MADNEKKDNEVETLAADHKIDLDISMVDVIDRLVQYANRYTLTNVDTGDTLGTFDFTEATGTVTTEGTEINREVFESIRASFDEAADQIIDYIESGDLRNAEVTLADTTLVYDGTQKTQAVEKVTLDGETLVEGEDYLVAGNYAINAGSYALIVVGIKDHPGVCAKAWSIGKHENYLTFTDVPTALLGFEGYEVAFGYETDGPITSAESSNPAFECEVDSENNTITIKRVAEMSETVEDVTVTVTSGGGNIEEVTESFSVKAYNADTELNNNSWDVISVVSNAGIAANIWDIGDMKSVTLNGAIGSFLTLTNTTLYVYIIGFDHNSDLEGVKGITFQGFKTEEGVSVALIDSNYNSTFSDGTLHFNLNHWGTSSSPYNTNYGGWKACDARYDIIGSTDVEPSGYGATKTTSVIGYDPTEECTANPVPNTLMAALPEEVRSVLKCVTKYTDNTGNSSTAAENVTESLDYIFLLAEWEIFGARSYANTNEQSSQLQYEYYELGNSRVKYQHSATGTACSWWGRSPNSSNATGFCSVNTNGNAANYYSRYSYGLAPAFVV